eukprot:scaffold2334_cov118-Cylindrotheca_fusiformis.AAC.35
MTLEISKAHFDNTLETVLAGSVCGIVFAAMLIIFLLVDIEASKASFLRVDPKQSSLDLQVEDSKNGMEVERSSSQDQEPELRQRRGNRVPCSFKMMQVGSVLILILLTYLLLVTSNAPLWLAALGSICVFGMFLRFQIGDEVRRQRWDRLTLMVSLLLLIAAFLNLSTYAWKSLKQGEIYMGPARIMEYDPEPYNNSNFSDPIIRTDLIVSWGKDWGCPFTGGKVCQAPVKGVMCASEVSTGSAGDDNENGNNNNQGSSSNQEKSGSKSSSNSTGKTKGKNSSNSTNDSDLEEKNEELEEENALLEKEVEELKEQNDEQVDEEADAEEMLEEEMIGDEFEDGEEILEVEDELDEAQADEDVLKDEMEKQQNNEEIEDTTDDSVKEEIEEDNEKLDEDIDETEAELKDEENEYTEIEDEYGDAADEYYDEASDAAEDLTEDYLSDTEDEASPSSSAYWDEEEFEYDDDMYDSEYWYYDWDSAWGDYGCSNLFDSDISDLVYNDSESPGGEDDWPFINIYGSCKTCDAYVMDYFAEEAFEQLDDYFFQFVMYMLLTLLGLGVSLIGFIKSKIAPPAENQVELLGSD